jgi:glycerol transport system ATP-binding protein
MSLVLENVRREVAGQVHIRDVSLELARGSLNVLLGATLAGKTTLMRLMAGLDVPTSGRVLVEGRDVTGGAGEAAQRRHGLPAIHQLPGAQRL